MPATLRAPAHVAVNGPIPWEAPLLTLRRAAVPTPEMVSLVAQPGAGTWPTAYIRPAATPVTVTTGALASTLPDMLAVPVLPARSVQLAVSLNGPLPVVVLYSGHSLATSVPESVQFHSTITG